MASPESPQRWVRVGRVGRPHGRDGSFVVEEASEAPERLAPGARVYLAREAAVVVSSKRAGGRPVIKLDRDAPRGAALELPASELPEPEEGAFYAFQLEGLTVTEEGGQVLGVVVKVAPGVANDVLELDTGLLLPMVEACIRTVNLEEGRILVTQGFAEGS